MRLLVDPIWPWPLVVLAVLGLLLLVLWTYPPRVRHLPPLYRRLLLGLRLAAVVLLALAILRPGLQFSETDKESSVLVVLTDVSRSMNTADAPGGITRRQAVLRTLADCAPQLTALAEEIDVRYFDFSAALTSVENPADAAEGTQTALGAVLEAVLKETESNRLMGVVLMSDGAQRAMAPYDADPRMMARRLGELQVPIYTIPYGGAGVNESAMDVAVEDLLVSPVVFEKKLVPVSAKLRVLGAAGRKLSVRLLSEDRSGKRPGESGEMKVAPASGQARPSAEVEVRGNSELIPVELSYVPQRAGEFKIALEVVPIDGELKQTNNRQETILTVRQGGVNVAYFDQIRPEQKYLKIVNRSDKIQLDFQPVRGGEFEGRTEIDARWFERDQYDVYIIGDVPASVFGPTRLRELAARVNSGAGLLMTGGYHNFGAGGYADTPLADLLPVAMDSNDYRPGQPIDEDLHVFKPLQMLPTSLGLREFVMRLDTESDNLKRWQSLPPLEGANKLRKKVGLVQVLAESPDGLPLLLAQEVGPARVMALGADTTWQWVMGGQEESHQRFWRQMILWLAHKEMDTDQPVWVLVEPRNFAPSQRVEIRFGARSATGEPVTDAEFQVQVANPAGETQQPVPRNAGREHTAEFADTEVPGDYWVRVRATHAGDNLGLDAWTRFIVDARDLEMDNPAADLALMEEIAALTGGLSLPPEQLVSHLSKLLEDGLPNTEITKHTRLTLWDNWPFLFAFVGVMTVEWFFRKRRGLV